MADITKMSTCPICGYTDTADDADALHMAITEHVRMAHNLDAATLGGASDSVKPVSDATAAEVDGRNLAGPSIPIIAAAPNTGGGGPDGTGAGYGPGAGLLAADMADDNVDTTNVSERKDETSRF